MTVQELKDRLFKLVLEIDRLSVKKDYDGLRMLHHENCDWLNSVGLGFEYYDYFFKNEIAKESEEDGD